MLASELERLGRRRDDWPTSVTALLALRSQVATEDSPCAWRRGARAARRCAGPRTDRDVGRTGRQRLPRRRGGCGDRTSSTRATRSTGPGTASVSARSTPGRHRRGRQHPPPRRAAQRRQEQHVVETFEHEFAIFGDEVVVTPSTWGDPARPTSSSATPCSSGPSRAGSTTCGARHRRATTAHRSTSASSSCSRSATRTRHRPPPGVALRTVRRRVAGLMDDYQVHTRFQLGAALAHDDRA